MLLFQEEANSLILLMELACTGNVDSKVNKTLGSGKLESSTEETAVERDFQAQRLALEDKNAVPFQDPLRMDNGTRLNVPSQSEVTRSFLKQQEMSISQSVVSKSTRLHAAETDVEELLNPQ